MSELTQAQADDIIAKATEQPSGIAGTNDIETAFVRLLVERKPGAFAYRSGWPDFLVEHEGRFIGVEVKNGVDKLSKRQRVMFAALERAGIVVYVWHPRFPRALRPWRKHRPRSWWDKKATKASEAMHPGDRA